MGVSVFLPWLSATTILGFNLSLIGFELSAEIGMLAILFLVIDSLIVWFHNKPRHSGIACLGMGFWMLFEALLVYVELQNRVTSFSTDYLIVRIGPGFYLLVVGVFITLVGGVLLATTKIEANPSKIVQSSPEVS